MDHVLFPRFWIEEPALWFAQIEAVFALNNIILDTDKYNYILCELPSTAISLIKDLILDSTNQYEGGKYQRVKQELIKRISLADLSKEEIGSKKPSVFFKYLKEKANPLVSEEAVKELWLKKLPLHVNYIVSDLKGDFESVCKLADNIKEYIPQPCRLDKSATAKSSNIEDLTQLLENLATRLETTQSELFKIQALYNESNTNLERMQAELHKFKLVYSDNNTRLESLQIELQKMKLSGCSENKNSDICKTCDNNDAITKTNDEKSDHTEYTFSPESHNISEDNNSENCNSEINESETNDKDEKSEMANKEAFCWYHTVYGKDAHNCLQPCNYTEKMSGK